MQLVERVHLLQQAQDDSTLQKALMELCRRDPVYWFNTFCWTFDPRKSGSGEADMPFNLFPFQEWCIREWYNCIDSQLDFGIEKSRDMGASWMLILLFHYCLLFRPGWNFHVGSRKEDLVDTATLDPSTLFGKLLYNHTRLPKWMRGDIARKKLIILNNENGNLLTGESANPAFGRGPRERAILLDELAYWDCADSAWGGCSATTNCRIAVSTPCGESNRFASLMLDPNNELRIPPIDGKKDDEYKLDD